MLSVQRSKVQAIITSARHDNKAAACDAELRLWIAEDNVGDAHIFSADASAFLQSVKMFEPS